MDNTTRLIIGISGEIIDKNNGFLVANDSYSNMIQVISPFPASDSVKLEFYLRNARVTTYTQYIGLKKDDSGNPITAKDVVPSTETYYQSIKEWYVWQTALDPKILSAISKYHAGKVDVTVKFYQFRNLYVEEALNRIGTFGSRKSTTGGDLPAAANIGDYYECDFLDYYSYQTAEYYTLMDYAYYTESGWLKGIAYQWRKNSASTQIGVDPSIFGQDIESLPISIADQFASRISSLESSILDDLPEEYADGLFIKKEIDLNYENKIPEPTDKIILESDRTTYYADIEDLTIGLNEVESEIIRTPSALSSTSGNGLYASDSAVLLGSATGSGITWDGSNLYIRGTIQSGNITDSELLESLRGTDGDTTYIHYAYSTSSDGSQNFSTSSFIGATYIGFYTDTVDTDSEDYEDYDWSLFKGSDGSDGSDGRSITFKGTLSYLSDLSFISNPKLNDVYSILETNELWIYNGSIWENLGSFKGDDARYVTVHGGTIFKYQPGESIPVNTSITLTAELYGDLSSYSWQYWNGTAWSTLSSTEQTYTVDYDSDIFIDDLARIRCISDDGFYDEHNIVNIVDGDTYNTYWAYADTSDGSGATFSTTYYTDALYIGRYESLSDTQSETYTDYIWSRFKGDDAR
jgi:hypothetical protein